LAHWHIRNISKQIFKSGNTDDIIRVVMMAYEIENDPQICKLAHSLRGKDVYQTSYNIWKYLIDNVRYVADVDNQKIKTPARLLHDGTGDCKSYSLITAVILRCLGIPHVFRFVSYTARKEATHVYVVAYVEPMHASYVNKNEVIIDAVAAVQANKPFNEEIKYKWKVDMSKNGTEIYYVAGLPGSRHTSSRNSRHASSRNKIGSLPDYSVWLGNEDPALITEGKYWLYGKYDLISEMAKIAGSAKETNKLYSQLAIVTALIHAYNLVKGDNKQFRRLTLIICGLIYQGLFDISGVSDNDRDRWFVSLLGKIEWNFNNNIYPVKYDTTWYTSILNNVLAYNSNQSRLNGTGISGLDLLAPALKKAGIYFIYLFIPIKDLEDYDPKVAKKRATQLIFKNLIAKVSGRSDGYMMDTFRAGIIARTGMQPEAYIAFIKNKNARVGEAIVATIAGILSIALGLLELIKAIWPNSEAASLALSSGAADLDNELYNKGTGGKNPGSGKNGDQNSGFAKTSTAFIPWLIGGSLVFTILMKKK